MKIGLCMVVKNEAGRLVDCLGPIVKLFDQTVVVDTGSTDGTQELLLQQFGIKALHAPLEEDRCFCLQDPRSRGLQTLSTPWIMFLDADERIEPTLLEILREIPDDPSVAGYFGHWHNYPGVEPEYDDYKLFLFRHGLRPLGLVHDNVQLDIRKHGLRATWLDELVVKHFPDPGRIAHKQSNYRKRLDCAIAKQPDFLRYHWFRGYMDFRSNDFVGAEQYLSLAAMARSTYFPVECLNSAMVLSEIYAKQGRDRELTVLLGKSLQFHALVAKDFEVQINTGIMNWLTNAAESCQTGQLNDITAPRFAY